MTAFKPNSPYSVPGPENKSAPIASSPRMVAYALLHIYVDYVEKVSCCLCISLIKSWTPGTGICISMGAFRFLGFSCVKAL
jgi:hypothetical protein